MARGAGRGTALDDPQVTAHVTKAEREGFEAYARKFGLDAGNLLHLLWQHELRVERLALIDQVYREPGPRLAENGLKAKVTAHLTDTELKPRIEARATAAGLPVSRAGAIMLREEMVARWLANALNFSDSN
jgi:hypothetical protein